MLKLLKSKTSLIILLSISLGWLLSLNYNLRRDNKNMMNSLSHKLIFIDSVMAIQAAKEMNEFTYVFDRFKIYNENIDTSTVKKFIEVVQYFSLDTTQLIYDYAISQICLESGAKQYYCNGDVVKSSGDAYGITQIVPTTAFSFLRYELSDKDKSDFINLGAQDISFVISARKQRKVRPEVIEWLSNETNNLILWGYIMRYTLERKKYDVVNTLIVYNGGDGFLNKYLRSGKDPDNFEYVKMVRGIRKRLNRKLNSK